MANLLDYVGLGHFLEKIKTLFVTGLGTSGNNLTWTKNGTTNNITIPYATKAGKLSVTSTDNAVVRFDGTSGAVQNSGVTINDSSQVTAARFITSGGTASQVVLGNGSLAAAKELPQYEAYLEWGGKNFSGNYGPIDAAMVAELGACRTMFSKAAGLLIEYSTDSGTTWINYGASDSAKVALFSVGNSFYTGANITAGGGSPNNMLRVTLRTSAAGIYTTLNKFVIFVGSNGSTGCYCTIRCRTQQNYEDDIDTWVTLADQIPIQGWTGYNVINISPTTTYGNTKNTQYGEWQFIFGSTGFSGSSTGLYINKIFGFGGMGWVTPSNMAKTGHLYSYDSLQNTTFPAQVTATAFKKVNGTSSQFLKADGSIDSTSYGTYSKPSGGIPASDLASAVQTSLGKADSALQSFTETDPTVPSWAKQSSKPTYTAQEVGALPSTTSIPSKTSDLTNDSGFVTTSDISGVYKYKGTKTNYSNLPTSGNVTGDVWNVTNANGNIPAGTNYAWNGSAWDALGGSVDLSGYVPTSRTINGKALTSNITLSASDVSALPSSTTIPTALADLTDDSTHRLVTDTEKSTWNGKQSPATTLAGYGITDAKIQNGVITLGSNSITPLTSHQSLSNYVTLNGAQSITGEKTFTGDKRIKFKQGTAADKLGFTLYDNSNVEVGYLEWQSSGLNSKPTLVLGQWISQQKPSTPGYLGFKLVNVLTATRYMLVTPLLADAKTPLELNDTIKTFYFPLQFKNGTNTVLTDNAGVVDLATLLQAYELASNKVTSIDSSSTDNQYPSAKCVYEAIQNNSSGDYVFTEGEDIYGDFTPINNGYGFVQGTGNYNNF